MRQGVLDSPPKTPVTMGFECAGEVEAVGENTQGVAVSIFISFLATGHFRHLLCKQFGSRSGPVKLTKYQA